jgi:hypothetical protein
MLKNYKEITSFPLVICHLVTIVLEICITIVRVVTLAPKGQSLSRMEQEILLSNHT